MENFKITETQLWAYISKTADTDTIKKVEVWMESSDFDETLFNQTVSIYKDTLAQDIDVEKAKKQFFKTVTSYKQQKSFAWKSMLKYAAILLLFITATFTYQYLSSGKNSIIVQTTFGEQKQLKLPDGSTVWLNASSKLSYSHDSPRTLYLEGEAFFEVAKDKAHPFTVTTSDYITVKALGTSFNVKSYQMGLTTETKLLTGKVEVTSSKYFKNKVLMKPNEKVTYFKNENKIVKSKMKPNEGSIAWRAGKIQFKNKTFKEIALDLKVQFNIKINFQNKELANSKFTGAFDKNTPINEIFDILKISKDFNYQLKLDSDEWIIN